MESKGVSECSNLNWRCHRYLQKLVWGRMVTATGMLIEGITLEGVVNKVSMPMAEEREAR